MANEARIKAVRSLNSAANSIDKSARVIHIVAEKYEKQHPEISKPLYDSIELLCIASALVERVRTSF